MNGQFDKMHKNIQVLLEINVSIYFLKKKIKYNYILSHYFEVLINMVL